MDKTDFSTKIKYLENVRFIKDNGYHDKIKILQIYIIKMKINIL